MEQNNERNENGKIYFWLAVAACVLQAVALGLTFTVLGVYATISSVILGLCALTFLNAQKKRSYFTACKIVRICAYALILLCFALLIGAAVYVGTRS